MTSARDEFPARPDGTTWTVDNWPEMCDLIDQLRADLVAAAQRDRDAGNREIWP